MMFLIVEEFDPNQLFGASSYHHLACWRKGRGHFACL